MSEESKAVYVMTGFPGGLVKVGISNQPGQRLEDLQLPHRSDHVMWGLRNPDKSWRENPYPYTCLDIALEVWIPRLARRVEQRAHELLRPSWGKLPDGGASINTCYPGGSEVFPVSVSEAISAVCQAYSEHLPSIRRFEDSVWK
jgi:hypothetical protein